MRNQLLCHVKFNIISIQLQLYQQRFKFPKLPCKELETTIGKYEFLSASITYATPSIT
jgi:hypothetical protein